mgnify:CR=1 FL=1
MCCQLRSPSLFQNYFNAVLQVIAEKECVSVIAQLIIEITRLLSLVDLEPKDYHDSSHLNKMDSHVLTIKSREIQSAYLMEPNKIRKSIDPVMGIRRGRLGNSGLGY